MGLTHCSGNYATDSQSRKLGTPTILFFAEPPPPRPPARYDGRFSGEYHRRRTTLHCASRTNPAARTFGLFDAMPAVVAPISG
jgi:hypothetical protein